MIMSNITPEDEKRVKSYGFLINKGTDKFSARVITVNGKITAKKMQCIVEAAEKYGNGVITFTSRLAIECQGIHYDDIDNFRNYIAKEGLITGGTGAKVRPIVSCKGTTCKYGLIDTFDITEDIHNKFFIEWGNVSTPHKFKIGVSGCPNSCIKPDLNDFGVFGQIETIYDENTCKKCKVCLIEEKCPMGAAKMVNGKLEVDRNKCTNCGLCINICSFKAVTAGDIGYKVTLGGRWGKKKQQGKPIRKMFKTKDDVMDAIEKTILIYKEQGIKGERLADTLNRIGFENFEEQLYSDDILDKKEIILNEN